MTLVFFLLLNQTFAGMPIAPPSYYETASCLSNVKFRPMGQGLQELGRSLDLMEPYVKLEVTKLGDKEFLRCGGTFVSDYGHILTASHCLDRCAFDEKEPGAQPQFPIVCEARINDKPTQVRVLAMQNCKMDLKIHRATTDPKDPNDPHDPRFNYCDDKNLADIALILPISLEKDFKCSTIADRKPSRGESLIALGQPIPTARAKSQDPSAWDADGNTRTISMGKLDLGQTCNLKLPNGTTERRPAPQPDPTYNENLFKTTVDILKGTSGGPLFDRNNQIIGVAMSYYSQNHNEKQECVGSGLFQTTAGWKAKLKKLNPNLSTELIKCRDKAAFPIPSGPSKGK